MLETLFERFDSLLVLDTETTGFAPRRDEVIELAMLRLTPDGGEESYDEFIRLSPGRELPARITELTGITEDMLRLGVSKASAARALADMLGKGERTLVCAYNAQFDLSFLYYFLARFGLADCLRGLKFLDALTVFRDRRPYPHKLENAIEAYDLGGQAVNSHRAIDDARATVCLLEAMAAEENDLDRYVNLFGYNPRYGISGKPIGSITYCAQSYDPHPPLYMLSE